MSPRPTRALLGALTLAAAVITAGHPVGAGGPKAPPCPPTPTVIVSNAGTITGTECADWIHPGIDTTLVRARGGDDRVIVQGPPSTTMSGCCGPPTIAVDLGPGDDLLRMERANQIFGEGGPGDDDLRADWLVPDGWLSGQGGDDRIWTSSDEVDLSGGDDDDRLTVTAVTPPGDDRYWTQALGGGSGDDVLSSAGASGPRLRALVEGPGDDTYLVRQGPAAPGRERIIPGLETGGHDVAVIDPVDVIDLAVFGEIEEVHVAWAP